MLVTVALQDQDMNPQNFIFSVYTIEIHVVYEQKTIKESSL